MKDERRSAVYDDELHLEAYRFEGIVQPFPTHFHEHYVLGLVERGERRLSCCGGEFTLRAGDLLLLNPGDSHACEQCGGETLDYRSLTITQSVMRSLSEEITGTDSLPRFSPNVLRDSEAACDFRALHELVLSRSREFEKEEALLLLLSRLFERCALPFAAHRPPRGEINAACELMQRHFAERITLDQLCRCAHLSKSTLLRAFTREKGVTPYRYLEAVRISEAKKLLEQGASPAEAALRTGFSDQSHFTNFFTRFIGLAPGVYREIFTTQPAPPKQAEPKHT